MAGAFEVYVGRENKYRWRLKARNGQVVATGEAHQDAAGAVRQCEQVQLACDNAKIEEVDG